MSSTKLLAEANQAAEQNAEEKIELTRDINLDEQLPQFIELLPEQIQPYWSILNDYPLVQVVLILVFFWALAHIILRYAVALLERLAAITVTELDDQLIKESRRPIFSLVLWFGVMVAFRSAGYIEGIFTYITPFALSMIALSLLRASFSISELLIITVSRDPAHFNQLDIRTEPLLIIGSKILLMVVAAYTILLIWGINPVGLVASAGIVGIAVGFAAKDTLANLFSGVFIVADRPYRLGDYVNLDSGERGKITHIGLRSTRLLTRDDIEVIIPNGIIGNEKIVNESGGSAQKMRIRIRISCAYESNLDHVEKVLMEVADQQNLLCKHPAPRVRVRDFADSGINLELLGWIEEPELRGQTSHLLYKDIHRAFDKQGIEIPYPRLASIPLEAPQAKTYND